MPFVELKSADSVRIDGKSADGKSAELDRLFAADGPLARYVPGYVPRPDQLELARSVHDALAGGRRLLVEAPCGSGKTLAYCLPAFLYARESGRRVVIATSTIPLQGQLLEGEAAVAAAVIPGLRCVKLLGRGNYLCLRRAAEALGERRLSPKTKALLEEVRARDGELEAASAYDRDLAELTCDFDLCENYRCPYFQDCFHFRKRREARAAEVTIVNHALWLSEARGTAGEEGAALAGALPDRAALIVDEAHRLPEAITSAGTQRLSPPDFYRALFFAERLAARLRLSPATEELARRLAVAVRDAAGAVEGLFSAAEEKYARAASDRILVADPGATPFARAPEAEALTVALDVAAAELSSLRDLAGAGNEPPEAARSAAALTDLADRLRAFRVPPHDAFLWLDRGEGPAFHLTPYRVDADFRRLVAGPADALVLLSGTLALAGDFSFYKSTLDLRDSIDLSFSGDFELGLDRLLHVARDLPSPKESGFFSELVMKIEELVRAIPGKTLVLFTSLSLLRSVADELRVPFSAAETPLLVQGEGGRAELLRRFRRERNAVLFASVSFWEGIDVREDPIRSLILTRLPFQPPDDPVIAARSARLKEDGGDPFRDLFIPAAALKLKQGIGRLIRDRSAWGIVSVLDSRLLNSRYGKLLMPAFGDMKVVTGMDEVRSFVAERA